MKKIKLVVPLYYTKYIIELLVNEVLALTNQIMTREDKDYLDKITGLLHNIRKKQVAKSSNLIDDGVEITIKLRYFEATLLRDLIIKAPHQDYNTYKIIKKIDENTSSTDYFIDKI